MRATTIRQNIQRVLDIYEKSRQLPGATHPLMPKVSCKVPKSDLTPGEYVLVEALIHAADWEENAIQEGGRIRREFRQPKTLERYASLMGLLWPEMWYMDIDAGAGGLPYEFGVDQAYTLLQHDYLTRLGIDSIVRKFITGRGLPAHLAKAVECLERV